MIEDPKDQDQDQQKQNTKNPQTNKLHETNEFLLQNFFIEKFLLKTMILKCNEN